VGITQVRRDAHAAEGKRCDEKPLSRGEPHFSSLSSCDPKSAGFQLSSFNVESEASEPPAWNVSVPATAAALAASAAARSWAVTFAVPLSLRSVRRFRPVRRTS
jgi:hypothetical protein